jgi:hypothetical protein
MPAIDDFQSFQASLESPAAQAIAVTPSDSVPLGHTTRALWVGGGGDVAVLMQGQNTPVTFASVPDGTLLPIRVDQVMSTDTTATAIVALW